MGGIQDLVGLTRVGSNAINSACRRFCAIGGWHAAGEHRYRLKRIINSGTIIGPAFRFGERPPGGSLGFDGNESRDCFDCLGLGELDFLHGF